MSFCLVCPSCDWPAPPSDRPEDICPWCGEEMIDPQQFDGTPDA